MKILKKILVKCSGNRLAQQLLMKNVEVSHFLMGIGSGEDPVSSGEGSVFSVIKTLNPPLCIFDVGSNTGQFLQLALKNLETEEFTIHCFEPGRLAFEELVRTAKGDRRISLNNIGIGKEVIEKTLFLNCMSLVDRRLEHFGKERGEEERVKVTTLDNYCGERNISKIDLLKLDIEGLEFDALEGARNLFSNRSIGMVTFEFGGCNIDTKTYFQDFWYFFKDSMDIFRITPSGYLCSVGTYSEVCEQFRTTNYLAVPRK